MVIKHNNMVINSSDKTCRYCSLECSRTPVSSGTCTALSLEEIQLYLSRKGTSLQALPLDKTGRGPSSLIKRCSLEIPHQAVTSQPNQWKSNINFKTGTSELIQQSSVV